MTIQVTRMAGPVRQTMATMNVRIDVFDQLCVNISEGVSVLIGDMSTMPIYHA